MSLLRFIVPEPRNALARAMSVDARAMLASLKKKQASEFVEGGSFKKEQSEGEADQLQKRETPAEFLKHRQRMKERFPEGWNPPRKLSREAMDGLRVLHKHDPVTFSTSVLAERFKVSPEAVRRILRSKWQPNREERTNLLEKDRKRKQEFIQQRLEREKTDRQVVLDRERTKVMNRRRERDELTLR